MGEPEESFAICVWIDVGGKLIIPVQGNKQWNQILQPARGYSYLSELSYSK